MSTSSSEECLPNILSIFVNFTVFLVFNDVQFSICLQSAITDVHSRKACLIVSIPIVHIGHMFVSDNFITYSFSFRIFFWACEEVSSDLG